MKIALSSWLPCTLIMFDIMTCFLLSHDRKHFFHPSPCRGLYKTGESRDLVFGGVLITHRKGRGDLLNFVPIIVRANPRKK